MKRPNRGKGFETKIKEACLKIKDVSIDRIPDQMGHYKGAKNICDFIAYKRPNQYYIECKSVYDTSLPFSNISEDQWKGLIRKSEIPGVIAGIMVWFIDYGETYFIPISNLKVLREQGVKSINPRKDYYDYIGTDLWKFKITGKKDRIYYKYDLEPFFNKMREYYLL